MKLKNKLIITFGLSASLIFTTSYLTSCSNNNFILPNTHLWANTYDNEMKNFNYYQNDFLDDIEKLANDDSVLFYDIGWVATLHKYVPIAHILKILEINPNKEIYLYINNFALNKEKIDFQAISTKFPNFKYKFYDGLGFSSTTDYKDFNIQITNEIMNDINFYKLNDRNKNLFTSDYTILRTIEYNKKLNQQNINSFMNNFLPLLNFNSINLISDGTASTDFFNDDLFYYMATKSIYEFDVQTNMYENSKKTLNYFLNLSFENKVLFLQNNKYNITPTDILMMFNTSAVGNQNNNFCKFNYYFPSLNSIIDINSQYSSNLSLNFQTQTPLFFNPYLTKNLNFIGMFRLLSKRSISYFYNILKIQEPIDLTQALNNNINLIVAGNLMDSNFAIENELKKIIAIYKMNEINSQNLNLNIKVWYKAHPREQDNYKDIIINKLNEKGLNKIALSIEFLNKTLPFELLISNDYLIEDPSSNRYISIYTGFSTISLLADADNKSNLIKKVIVDDNTLNTINQRFGSSKENIIFNNSKIIHIDDLYNSYNYLTNTNPESSYFIYKNNIVNINYKTFNLYEFNWQTWSNIKFDVVFKIENNEYLFENCVADNKKKGGINISNLLEFEKIISNNKNSIKEYNLTNWNNDSISKNLFPYMNNLIDFNNNMMLKPSNFLTCTIKINYKSKNKTLPFIPESGFIIFFNYNNID